MELVTKAVLFHGKDIETFSIKILNKSKARLVREKLEGEKKKIVNYLKRMMKRGEIKSIRVPKNKAIQKHLDEMTNAKREINKSIDQIKEVFFR